MPTLPYPVIVVPGITATYLRNEYPLPPDFPWTVMTQKYERVTLHPDDLRYDIHEPARVQAGQVFEIAYSELIEELRYNLSPKADMPVPVYPFGYDWRQPLEIIEAELETFIDEVISRTRLMPHYFSDKYEDDPRVNLVGHSMGGMIIAGCIDSMSKKGTSSKKIGKVATLATPFKGSFEAVVKVATGTANLGGNVPSSREREAARLTPSIYHLFPSIKDESVYDINPALNGKNLFDPALMQPSILETIVDNIRLYGKDEKIKIKDQKEQAELLVSTMLKQAKNHRNRIEQLSLSDAGMVAEDWLCVVGVGSETRVRMHVANNKGKPLFDLTKKDRMNSWSNTIAKDGFDPDEESKRRLTGDGTVSFDGAVPGFLQPENLVCVTPDDYGYWELKDRALTAKEGFHGILPNMNMLHRLLTTHFKNQKGDRNKKTYKNIWGRPAPGVTKMQWSPAIPGLQPKEVD